MTTNTRKQREIQQRERMLLRIARKTLIEQGFAHLSLDRLADATEYSKGTIYQHFSSKEDLVAALAVQSCEKRVGLFSRAVRYPGTCRERVMALLAADEFFAERHPHYFKCEMIIRMANLDEKASPERRDRLEQLEQQLLNIVLDPIRQAVACGELPLSADWTPEKVVFALFSLAMGGHIGVLNYSTVMKKIGVTSRSPHLFDSVNVFLDGLNWNPLSSKFDYASTVNSVIQEVLVHDDSADET